MIEQLVNAYFSDVAPMLPVVTREEFIANNPPPPILLYSICLVAATRRDVPQKVFESIRYTVNSLIKAEDVLSTASIVNMQSLLILAMVGDCHSQYVPHALSALWVRLGCAIRMVGCLLALSRQLFAYLAGGLHRTFRRKTWACTEPSLSNRTLRCADGCGGSASLATGGMCPLSAPPPAARRTRARERAAATLTHTHLALRISLTFGHPYMIDIRDCDARLPSSGDPNDLYLDELVRLSVILGRVQKTIYT